jgi:hypothetical protein
MQHASLLFIAVIGVRQTSEKLGGISFKLTNIYLQHAFWLLIAVIGVRQTSEKQSTYN